MIYVVGIGPGGLDEITPRAMEAMKSCDVIVGYTRYVELVRDIFPDKDFITSGMRSELERCTAALNASLSGKNAALISSGDAGVYGMAGLMLEVAEGSGQEVRIIPGITAANSCAAVLGAPLMNDYAAVSLSDILTDWDTIEKRLIAACDGDFVICLYNPASHHRPDHFRRACEILLAHGKSPDTPAGYVRNIGREGQTHEIMTLGEIMSIKIDMLCTIIIGNSQSYVFDGKIITPRGYNTAHPNREG
ncbi:MAG: precorrin-3B C(17)-methyltransferase [Synergistaceae bacterium]|nr:precorrin-3B C(17)-methyltransferase [Synergistaceae bacterium]